MKSILVNENYNSPAGYIIEEDDGKIYTTFWSEEKEVRMYYNSLDHLYEKSKLFVGSNLINYSELHKSQYKMMCDFIAYHDNMH